MADEHARRRRAELPVDGGQQLPLDEVEESIAPFARAAPAHRKPGRREIAQTVGVLDRDDHQLGDLTVVGQLRAHRGRGRAQRLAVEYDGDGIAVIGGAARVRRRKLDADASRLAEDARRDREPSRRTGARRRAPSATSDGPPAADCARTSACRPNPSERIVSPTTITRIAAPRRSSRTRCRTSDERNLIEGAWTRIGSPCCGWRRDLKESEPTGSDSCGLRRHHPTVARASRRTTDRASRAGTSGSPCRP